MKSKANPGLKLQGHFIRKLRKGGDPKKFLLWALLLLLLGLGSIQKSLAQCAIACKATTEATALNLALNANCSATITAEMFMDGLGNCPGNRELEVRDRFNTVLGRGTNAVTLNLSAQIGQLINVTVLNVGTQTLCLGFARVLDATPPTLVCRDTLIPCTADTSAKSLGFPVILDNCDPMVQIVRQDFLSFAFPCNSDTIGMIQRTWVARDRSGNASICEQRIYLQRPELEEIVFPKDTVLDCSKAYIQPDSTGFPTWKGRPIRDTSSLCKLTVSFNDVSVGNCAGPSGRRITRTWTIEETCSGREFSRTQVIEVRDATPPQIVCPQPIRIPALPSECFATVNLPRAQVTDLCDPNATFLVSTSFQGIGLGPHFNVPVGNYMVKYTAIDACGNTNVCFTPLAVEDTQVPVAVCDDQVNVTLSSNGIAQVTARFFDEGSNDNCVPVVYFKARRVVAGACDSLNSQAPLEPGFQEWFDDYVFFCCEDIGPKIAVVLRVYDINPGPGPVDPLREQPGGDLYGHFNDCVSLVEVRNELPPVITCPKDTTIECTESLTNLNRFGGPVVSSPCGFAVDTVTVVNLNECGRGTIKRTFTARDAAGRSSSCTQTITVVNNQKLKAEDIIWPKDTVLTRCGASTDIDSLPPGYNRPIILRQPSCGRAAIYHEDKQFNTSYPACYKVIRTWSIIDWCHFNPDKPSAGGQFTHTQIIKVEDREKPVIVSAPRDTMVAVTNGCASAKVTLPPIVAMDCSPNITITNNSPYAKARLADASGEYPLGTTTVTFRVEDGCGNVTTVSVKVTVKDLKKPSLVCFNGLSTSLMRINGTIMARVDVKDFVQSSFDNCTDTLNLKYTIRFKGAPTTTPPTATFLAFDCSTLGKQNVEVWATDESGNSDFCETFILITDNNALCPPDVGRAILSGVIQTEKGSNVEGVNVTVKADNPMAASTGVNGAFQIKDIPYGKDYTVAPLKDGDLLNGVTTQDLIRISKHVLGIQPLQSAYEWIAADIDKNGKVSTTDLVWLRKIILNRETKLPNGNTSWRFVDADFKFPAENPLQSNFPEIKNVNDLSTREIKANFIAVKVGDVNGSAIPNSAVSSEGRTTAGEMVVQVRDRQFEAGDEFTVDFISRDLPNLTGYQFTIRFDEKLLELKGLELGDLADLSEENFGFGALDRGLIATSWENKSGPGPKGEIVLFSLVFRGIRNSNLATAFSLSQGPTPAEAYDPDGELLQVLLQVIGQDGRSLAEGNHALYQNYPNPFNEETFIGFTLPKQMEVTLRIFDTAGRMVYTQRGQFGKGYNEIPIHRDELGGNGILFYQLSSESFSATRKMTLTARN